VNYALESWGIQVMRREFFTTADGVRLVFYRQGHGVPVLWQHGLGADQTQPAAVFPSIPGIERMTLMCRGHDESGLGALPGLSIAQFADDALALLDHLQIERAIVGGISLGAAITLRLAAHHPSRINALILARPAWVDAPSINTQNAYALAADHLERLGAQRGLQQFCTTEQYLSILARSPDNAQSLRSFFSRPRPETTIALLSRIPRDWPGITRHEMAAIQIPTLVIGNDQDDVHPLAYAQELSTIIPSARLETITSKTVNPQRYQQEFTTVLARFLVQLQPAGGVP